MKTYKLKGMHYKRGDAGVTIYDGDHQPVITLTHSTTNAEVNRYLELFTMAYEHGYQHGVTDGYDVARHDVSKALGITHE